jgi:hypothetical protein
MPAILALNRAEGLYGPYGNLRGGIPDAPSGRLVGGKTVAGNITTQDALPRPFVSGIDSATTSVTKPTGEIPYFGVVPILSPAIAFFQPDTITKINREAPMQVPNDGTDPFGGGAAFTNAFVVGGKKSDVWTYAAGEKNVSEPFPVGEPTVITVYNPKTGETTTQTTQQMGRTVSQQFETVTIPKTKTIVPTTTTVSTGQSGFDIFNKNISEKYVQPFTPTPEYATRSGYAFLHIRGEPTPEIQAGVKFFSEGFYGGIREKPATFGLSLGAGAALGTVWRGAGFVSSAVMPTITKAAPRVAAGLQLGGKSLPYIFGGAVVVETGYRSTEGFTNYELSSVATKTGDIVGTEIMPGFAGFDVGYHVPEHATGLYRGAVQIPGKVSDFSTRVGETYRKLPTVDQVRYKYLEWKSPSTAISQPMPSERFIRPSRNTGDMTGSAKGYFRARGYSEGFGSPRTGGSVSGRPTPRQESLKLNYNPTAPLTEIDVSGITPVIAQRGKIGGVRGSLSGKWDTAKTGTEDPFSNLPLKQRWKMRSAESGKQQEPGRGYYGGGKPTGGLQSGVGIGGTTVRSGRGAFELAMPSSGLVGPEGESLSPKPWEVTPSRRTAQRSRAYDLDYEYAARKLPEGMQRPSSRTERISETSVVVKPEVVSSVAQVPAMKPGQVFRQSPVQSTDLQKDRIVSPIAIPTMAVGVISLSAIMQKQNPVQLQAPRQVLNQDQLPQLKTVSTTKIVDLTNVNRVTGYDKRVSIDIETRIKVDPIVPPVIPPLGPGGSSAPAGLGYDSKAWKKSNPVGADLMKTHKGGFRPMKKMKMPKFKLPKF